MFTSACNKLVIRNTIFRKAPPSVVSGYGKPSINLNKVVATFEKHIFYLTLSRCPLDNYELKKHTEQIRSDSFLLITKFGQGNF
jgi:hypothetical protein